MLRSNVSGCSCLHNRCYQLTLFKFIQQTWAHGFFLLFFGFVSQQEKKTHSSFGRWNSTVSFFFVFRVFCEWERTSETKKGTENVCWIGGLWTFGGHKSKAFFGEKKNRIWKFGERARQSPHEWMIRFFVYRMETPIAVIVASCHSCVPVSVCELFILFFAHVFYFLLSFLSCDTHTDCFHRFSDYMLIFCVSNTGHCVRIRVDRDQSTHLSILICWKSLIFATANINHDLCRVSSPV